MAKSSTTPASSPSFLHKHLTANSSGSSIIIRTLFTALFFFTSFTLIGTYNFFSYDPGHRPSPQRIALLAYLFLQTTFFLAGMVLPWKILLFPFRRILEQSEQQDIELQTLGVDERNLYALEYYQEPDTEAPPPLMKRTFTVLKTALRPSDSFRVLGTRKGVETQKATKGKNITGSSDANAQQYPTTNLGRQRTNLGRTQIPSRNASTVTRNPSTVTRNPSNSSKMSGALRSNPSSRSLNHTPPAIVRITHPLESLTVTQPHNKLDFANPPPISRRNTGSSDRSYRTREVYELENRKDIWDTLKKLEGIRLSTVGEDHERYSQMMSGLELGNIVKKEDVPELSDGESGGGSGSSSSSLRKEGEVEGEDGGNVREDEGLLEEDEIPLTEILPVQALIIAGIL
ncbi:hypothetical protein L211DRAFT_837619 [Terfezia boudieri ATCC MYA-4762]|uniref:Uncharacterized protein n=1 Tax=Terfezia boudieri ATCC MYA-4762 TaxID=1051890 RepID=A0A3N4LMZ3_9PEZI|nr:hypothetical protein L211DRAFT_837619 [Terfezia boudieri ATCC MYA-4762]